MPMPIDRLRGAMRGQPARLRPVLAALAAGLAFGLPSAAFAASDAVCFFTRIAFQGQKACFPEGTYATMPGTLPQTVRSMRILHANTEITLCTRRDLGGRCATYGASKPRMPGSAFGRYKSMRIGPASGGGGGGTYTPRPNETCLYPERNFAGQPTCYRSTRIRYLPHVGTVRSIIPARRSYVYLCSRTNYRGSCRRIWQRSGKPFLVPRINNGSLVIVPNNRVATRLANAFVVMPRNSWWDFDSENLISRRNAPGTDLTLGSSDQGPVLRAVNGARMYVSIAQSGPQVQSCVAAAASGDRHARLAVLVGDLRDGQSICVRTADDSWAILTFETPSPRASSLGAALRVARLR